jgi:hypothetical protein
MERNKLTVIILVSAFVLFCLALSLSPSNSANSDSITPSESISKCWSPPGKEFTKAFLWEIDCWNAYPDTYYEPLVGKWIYVQYYSYQCGTGHWIDVGWYLTDCEGEIDLCGPPGEYMFTWVDADQSITLTCMEWSDSETIYCCRNYYVNYLTPKGGDEAFLFSLISVSPFSVTQLLERFPIDRG